MESSSRDAVERCGADAHVTALREGDAAHAERLVDALARRAHAVLRLDATTAALVADATRQLQVFFDAPPDVKRSIGPFRRVGATYAGYRALASAEFLELHTTADTDATVPSPPEPPGLARAAARLHAALDGVGRLVLRVLASWLGVPELALAGALDADDAEGPPRPSSSVLRCCYYRAEGRAVGDVLFERHTDSSLLTLSPLCTSAPGLQVADPSLGGEWVSVERRTGVTDADVGVHVGDLLAFLTHERFSACIHRVVRGSVSRLSMPLLLRANPECKLDTRAYPSDAVVHVEGIRCSDLCRLLDIHGKRALERSDGLALERRAVEEDRKARARAYRDSVRAGTRPLSDSESEDDAPEPPAPALDGARRRSQ